METPSEASDHGKLQRKEVNVERETTERNQRWKGHEVYAKFAGPSIFDLLESDMHSLRARGERSGRLCCPFALILLCSPTKALPVCFLWVLTTREHPPKGRIGRLGLTSVEARPSLQGVCRKSWEREGTNVRNFYSLIYWLVLTSSSIQLNSLFGSCQPFGQIFGIKGSVIVVWY